MYPAVAPAGALLARRTNPRNWWPHQYGEAVAVAGSANEDELAGGDQFEEGAVGEV